MVDYGDVLAARGRIEDSLPVTPVVRALALEERLGAPLYLKGELFQQTGSFKARGALNWLRSATDEELRRGLLTVSAGNHAMALAWTARALGASVTVVMPEHASPYKVEATRGYGAEVILHGEIQAALSKTEELRRERDLELVHPYDNDHILAGQGTVGLEVARQVRDAAVVVVPVGGGGLLAGIALALREIRPDLRIVGVEPEKAPTLSRAWSEGGPVRLESADTLAASLGAGIAGERAYAITREKVDDIVTVTEAEIRQGLLTTLTDTKVYAEPGGAVAVAALLAGKVPLEPGQPVVAVITGGNMELETLCAALRHNA